MYIKIIYIINHKIFNTILKTASSKDINSGIVKATDAEEIKNELTWKSVNTNGHFTAGDIHYLFS